MGIQFPPIAFLYLLYLFIYVFFYIIHIFVQWYKALLNLNLNLNLVVDNSKIKWGFCVNGTLKGYYYQNNIISMLVNWYLNISWKFLIFPSTTTFHVLRSIVQNINLRVVEHSKFVEQPYSPKQVPH